MESDRDSLPSLMRAMVLEAPGRSLVARRLPVPDITPGQVLLKVHACGLCRTDLHVVDGELPEPALPLVPGHQVVGRVVAVGSAVSGLAVGDRVGVPWLGGSCGGCRFCRLEQENLCDRAVYTGYQVNGGFAEYCRANADYCFPLPDGFSDRQVAPLLCAGLIGYRAYRWAMDADVVGLYGFGAAAHILIQLARYRGQRVFAFTRPGDDAGQQFARQLGAEWVGDASMTPPDLMDAAILFAPAGELVPRALQQVRKGGQVICAGIHMSDIPAFPYRDLWGERSVRSIANLTRRDGVEFLPLAAAIPIRTEVTVYPLAELNGALEDLRHGRFNGAAVIDPRV